MNTFSPPLYCGGHFGACAVGGSGLRMTPPDKGVTQWHAPGPWSLFPGAPGQSMGIYIPFTGRRCITNTFSLSLVTAEATLGPVRWVVRA